MTTETLVRVLPWSPGEALRLQWQTSGDTQPSNGSAEALAAIQAAARPIILLPGEQVLALAVDVPGANPRQRRQAAPFAAEEQLTQPIESLHVTVATPVRDEPVALIAIDRDWLGALLEALQAHGIEPVAAVADWQALPPGEVVCADGGERVLAHQAPWRGFSAEAELAAMLLDGPMPETASDQALFARLREGLAGRWQSINQLHGAFAPARQGSAGRGWRAVAALLAVVALLHVGLTLGDLWRLSRQSEALSEQQASVLREAFPNVQRVSADPAGQMQAMLNQLRSERGQFSGGEWFALMEPLAVALSGNRDARLQRVQYRSGSMEVELNIASIPELDDLREQLVQSINGATVEIASVVRSSGRVDARFLISRGENG